MTNAFDREVMTYADGMGISLYQRFSVHEASLFLRIQQTELEKLIKQHNISFIQITKTQVQFFGFQLIDYLINHIKTKEQPKQTKKTAAQSNRLCSGSQLVR